MRLPWRSWPMRGLDTRRNSRPKCSFFNPASSLRDPLEHRLCQLAQYDLSFGFRRMRAVYRAQSRWPLPCVGTFLPAGGKILPCLSDVEAEHADCAQPGDRTERGQGSPDPLPRLHRPVLDDRSLHDDLHGRQRCGRILPDRGRTRCADADEQRDWVMASGGDQLRR